MKRKRRKAVSKKQKETTFTDWALLGSVIGNILQAINQAKTAQDLDSARLTLQKVTVDRNILVRTLRQWQKGYLMLKSKAAKLEDGFIELKNAFSKQNEELYKLHQEQLVRDEQNENLKKENEKLKAENKILIKELKKIKEKKQVKK